MFENLKIFVLQKLVELEIKHEINLWILLILMGICTIPYYYSLYQMIKSLRARDFQKIIFWGSLLLTLIIIPYLYVLIWGKNIPWYIYLAIVLLLVIIVFKLVHKVFYSQQNTPINQFEKQVNEQKEIETNPN